MNNKKLAFPTPVDLQLSKQKRETEKALDKLKQQGKLVDEANGK